MMELFFNIVLQLVFLFSVLGILLTYGLYPLLMGMIDLRGKSEYESSAEEDEWPELNVVMAMYNEDAVIGDTLKSIVKSDYPANKLNVFVGSDNSTDDSHDIVSQMQEKFPSIHLEIFGGRSGKIKIINRLVEQIPGDDDSILLLCDANVVWSQDLARNLARHFKDETIGIVASNVVDQDTSSQGIAAQEEAYVNRENSVKHAEGVLWGRMMGAFGACYALRRSLYEPVPETFNVDDFYQTLVCYERGYNGIVDLDAICYESVSEDISEEFRRKKRISKGNFQNLERFADYLKPWNCGLTTFLIFWSHKGLRWFGPLLLIAIFVAGLILACQSRLFYAVSTAGMLATFFAAWLDFRAEKSGGSRFKLFKFIRYFYMMNLALLEGGVEFCRGVRNSVWEPTKRVSSETMVSGHAERNSAK